jgi:hypothetical protein
MSSTIVRWGGFAGIVAAVLFVTSTVLAQTQAISQAYDSPSSYLNSSILLVAFVAAAVAIAGLHGLLRSEPRYGRLGAVGAWVALIGYVVVALHTVFGMVVGNGQAVIEVRIAAALAVTLGSALLGIMTLRTRKLPWWCGVLLIVAFPIGDLSEGIVRGGEGILLAALWLSVGIAILRVQPAPVAATEPAVRA